MKESRMTAKMMLMMKKESTITTMTIKIEASTGFETFIKLYIVRAQLSLVMIWKMVRTALPRWSKVSKP